MIRRRVGTALVAACLGITGLATVAGASERQGGSGGDTVTVMIIAQLTEQEGLGTTTPEAPAAAEARARVATNKEQLPGGQELEVLVCDEERTPEGAEACARQAVDEGVAAVVGSVSGFDDAINPVLEEAGIANIGMVPISMSDFSSPIAFPLQSGTPGFIGGALTMLGDEGATTVKIAHIDVPEGAQTVGLADLVKPEGVTVAGGVPIPPSGQNMEPAVAEAADGAEGIVLATLPPSAAAFIQVAAQQGVDVPIANQDSGFTAETLEELGDAAEGTLVVSPYAPVNSDEPGIKQFNRQMKKFAKGEDRNAQFALGAWLAVDTFVKMAVDQNLTTIDAASVLQGMGALDGLELGGVIPPLTTTTPFAFAPLSRIFNPTVYPAVVEDGEVVGTGDPIDGLAAVGG